MSKAFTKEDDDAGVEFRPSASLLVSEGPFRLTARGAEELAANPDPRLRECLARAEVMKPIGASPERAVLGVTVHGRTDAGVDRSYRLVTKEEQGLLGAGCSLDSPLGLALLGAEVGESRTLRTPRGDIELEIVSLEGETS